MARRKPRCKWLIADPRSRSEKAMRIPIPVDYNPHFCNRPAWQEGYCRHHFDIILSRNPVVKAYNALQDVIVKQHPNKGIDFKVDEGFYG